VDARRLAYDTLVETDRSHAHADAVLGRALSRGSLSGPDRGLATLLVYGTLARQLTLDHSLAGYLERPLARLERRVLVLLRMGLFQLAYLDRVPDFAAVDTTVNLARAVAPAARGLVNGVLRRAAREGLAPPPDADLADRLSVVHSHPRWLVERLLDELGTDEAEAFMHADNEARPTVLRALLPRGSALDALTERGLDVAPAPLAPDAIVVSGAAAAAMGVNGVAGIAIPQAEASQLVALYVGAGAGQSVLDTCAAPGGKSAYLAALVGPSGRVVAVDPARAAARRIERLARAAGAGNVEIVNRSIQDLEVGDGFDAVLVDAPCSGLGTLSEHPEIRWRRQPQDIDDLAARQSAILAAAAPHVRPGGVLVYATCTVLRAENDDVVDDFLGGHPQFGEADDDELHDSLGPVVGDDGRLRTWPHRHGTGGFFAARLRRRA